MGAVAPKLKVLGLDKRFGDLDALRGIELEVASGEFIALVGPSGCGKTTFLRIVAGLEPASSGEVLLDGRAVKKPGGDRGFVFQNDNLLPWRSVFDNAMIGPEVPTPSTPMASVGMSAFAGRCTADGAGIAGDVVAVRGVSNLGL